MSSLQRKNDHQVMFKELKYRIARNSAFISMSISASLAPFTHFTSLISWVITAPKFGYNLYKTFRCKLERKKRNLPRPSGSLGASFVAPVIGLFLAPGLDLGFDHLSSLAAEYAAPYDNGAPPPDHQVDKGVWAVEEVIKAFGEEQVSQMVAKVLLGDYVDQRIASLSAETGVVNGAAIAVAKV
ncbi:hypothetical protein FRC17_000505 [Serendipita sp. 399]|nr:hypothetical protein FRC17_000505 [Serendipita sp. 399]